MAQLSLEGHALVCRSTASLDTARFDEHAHGQGHYVWSKKHLKDCIKATSHNFKNKSMEENERTGDCQIWGSSTREPPDCGYSHCSIISELFQTGRSSLGRKDKIYCYDCYSFYNHSFHQWSRSSTNSSSHNSRAASSNSRSRCCRRSSSHCRRRSGRRNCCFGTVEKYLCYCCC